MQEQRAKNNAVWFSKIDFQSVRKTVCELRYMLFLMKVIETIQELYFFKLFSTLIS